MKTLDKFTAKTKTYSFEEINILIDERKKAIANICKCEFSKVDASFLCDGTILICCRENGKHFRGLFKLSKKHGLDMIDNEIQEY